jgi:hypothetical protein
LRFDIVIPLPESDSDGINLLVLSLLASLGFALLLTLPVLLFPEIAAALLGQQGMQAYLWMFTLGVLFVTCYSGLQCWASRKNSSCWSRRQGLAMR